jgi:hypothetical protein
MSSEPPPIMAFVRATLGVGAPGGSRVGRCYHGGSPQLFDVAPGDLCFAWQKLEAHACH